MRALTIASSLLVLTAASGAFSATTGDVTGNWKDPDNGAILAFYDCDGDLCGKILTPSQPGKKDVNNPDPAKRGTPLADLVILDHGKKTGDASWKGNLYNTDDGKTYSGYATITEPGALQLKGCALIVFCKSIIFSKVP